MKFSRSAVAILVLAALSTQQAYATNGMNLSGYGPEAHAMGGASMAYDNGTAALMNNPATLGLMEEGHRFDAAIGGLFPSITAKAPTMPNADSSATAFYMPAMGWINKSGKLVYGAGVFSQGGMGTEYSATSFMAAGSGEKVRSEVGVGRVIVPLAYQLDEQFTVGGTVDYVWAGMDLKMALTGAQFGDMVTALGGTQTYGSASGSMVSTLAGAFGGGALTAMNWARVDFSNSSAFTGQAQGGGFAFKLGATFKASSDLTLGATFHSKTSMGDMNTSSASMSMNVDGPGVGGVPTTIPVSGSISVHNFQWPQTIGFGAAYQASDALMLVADYKRIGWKDVMKDFKVTFTADATQANPVATGFGLGGQVVDMGMIQNWDDQNVLQFGAAYKVSSALTVRGGVNVANNPVPDKYMNPLFPAIAKTNLSGGVGYAFDKQSSIDASFAYVPTTSATNGGGATVDFGGSSAQLLYSHRY
ncbi:MAG: outer membrane protein transport protein [Gammaproteobacteria bacterium]|nr:outer membrane protein transport protein [Gammaproteobacteria bacterium]MBU1625062.1 outer membrane protein transport protein [Gammaproteobacteria bacterium]MBU1981322.1 outer membrane protein transport protein [Gammaproteobacteria bacterium]